MKYKAIIFDMDGTIIDSEGLWAEASKHMLMQKGGLSEEECLKILPEFKGASLQTSCAYVKMAYNTKESIDELMREKEAFVFDNFATMSQFIDGFESFHQRLVAKGLASAIATNANQRTLDCITANMPLSKFFNEHIYCMDHVGKKAKPEPDVFLHAADKVNVEPTQCIAIEDSAHGVAAAKAAGMFCIGINTGNDRTALSQADLIIEHYDEIDLNSLL